MGSDVWGCISEGGNSSRGSEGNSISGRSSNRSRDIVAVFVQQQEQRQCSSIRHNFNKGSGSSVCGCISGGSGGSGTSSRSRVVTVIAIAYKVLIVSGEVVGTIALAREDAVARASIGAGVLQLQV